MYQSGRVGDGWVGKLLSNFTVAPIVETSSGRPFNILVGADRNFDFGPNTDRPIAVPANTPVNFCSDVPVASRYSPTGFLQPACYLNGTLNGNLKRNAGIKPTTVFTDLRIGRLFDLTEPFKLENMQPRLRAMTLMALSNRFGHLVLSTGNKSELAVGYCTLYGDMAGGLAVISDVPKTMIYELARWINRDREIIPTSTIEKAPSAELRPNQKDQDTLPPYEILDQILHLYVEENLSARDIIARGFDEKTVRWVQRRVDLNEYKREQAAPGLKVTSRAFGIGRKMPIAQRYVD